MVLIIENVIVNMKAIDAKNRPYRGRGDEEKRR